MRSVEVNCPLTLCCCVGWCNLCWPGKHLLTFCPVPLHNEYFIQRALHALCWVWVMMMSLMGAGHSAGSEPNQNCDCEDILCTHCGYTLYKINKRYRSLAFISAHSSCAPPCLFWKVHLNVIKAEITCDMTMLVWSVSCKLEYIIKMLHMHINSFIENQL